MPRPLDIPTIDQRHNNTQRRTTRLERRSAGPWHEVGDTLDPLAATFLNGVTNSGGTWMTTRYRYLLGGGYEYVINVNPPAVGVVCFNLPNGYYDTDGDTPVHGFDDQGASLSFKIVAADGGGYTAGDVVYVGP